MLLNCGVGEDSWESLGLQGDPTSWAISLPPRRLVSDKAWVVQFSSVAQLCLTLCDPMNRSTPGLPVHHYLPEFTQTHVPRVRDAIQPSHPRSSPSPPAPNPSQHQSFFQWVSSSQRWPKYWSFSFNISTSCLLSRGKIKDTSNNLFYINLFI